MGGDDPSLEDASMQATHLSQQIEQKVKRLETCDIVLTELDRLASYLAQQAIAAMPEGLRLQKGVSSAL